MFAGKSTNTSPLPVIDAPAEVRRFIGLAVAAGVVTFREIAKAAGKSNSYAQKCGDPASELNLPLHALASLPDLASFVLPLMESLTARIKSNAPRTESPETMINAVFPRVADWITAASHAMADQVITPDEARVCLKTASELRASLDRMTALLSDRVATRTKGGEA